jgi:sarcosine oxidase subunit beta
MWSFHKALRRRYDVVIIGGGVHGLATAYYLGKRGIRDVAVIEKRYIGSGASGRNTAIIRANYRTSEGIAFYAEGVRLYEALSKELDYNVLFSQQGHLTLAHSDRSVNTLRERAETNRLMGVNSYLVGPEEIRRMVPAINIDGHTRTPILAALYHPPGGIIRHDAVVWGYARGADRMGIELHPFTTVTGIKVEHGAVSGVVTDRGEVETKAVLNATAGYCSTISKMVGVDLPIVSHPLQALVTEPMKPLLDKVLVSSNLHVYINQTDRGEFVLGAEIDPYSCYSTRSTLSFLEGCAGHALEIMPDLHQVRVLRQWAGVCDMTPDFSPIIGEVEEVRGFFLDVGWGTYGFKAGPVAGYRTAELIATGEAPDLIRPFALSRFHEDQLVGEKAAAAVSH